MSIYCELMLNQPPAGIKVGTGGNERWLTVKIRQLPLSEYFANNFRFTEWTGEGYSAWGRYSIVNDYKFGADGIFTIGLAGGSSGSTTSKIWRYNVAAKELHFGQIAMWTSGDYEVTKELTLYSALALGNKIMPFGTSDYASGFVDVASSSGKLFEKRTIFWQNL